MKKIITLLVLFACTLSIQLKAQEKFGKTLNLGLGIGGYSGYYNYVGRSLPVFSLNYEFDVAKNFTLAPFISLYSYSYSRYWGNNQYPDRWYTYRETVIPIGLKGTYYFDELFKANAHWDFYASGSLGFALVNSRWDDGYYGDKNYYKNSNINGPQPLFLDLHIGAEYHFNKRIGAFLDLSTGVSTIGIAIH